MIKLKDLTLREKIGQTVIINHPLEMFEKYGGYKEFLTKYPVGGIYFGGAIVGGPMGGAGTMFEQSAEWNKYLKVPFIACCDSPSTDIPSISNAALGATDDEELAYKWGCEYGKLCRRNNMHLLFSPVCDLALEPLAPISQRAYGDDPEQSARLSLAFIKGVEKYNVIATAKHYPGMGHELIDTHIAPVGNRMSKEEWDNTYRKIYSHLIDNGLKSIMTAHMSLPCYQKERDERGLAPLATASKELATDLLRNDLGFKGITVTDGLIMGGAGGSSCEFEIKSFCSGNDMLLWPCMEYFDVMEQKILSGEISEKYLDEVVERILKAKEFAFSETDEDYSTYEMEELAEEISMKAISIFNNRKNVIPIDKNKVKKILLVALHPNEIIAKRLQKLSDVLAQYGFEVHLEKDIWTPKLRELEKTTDLTIFAFFEGTGLQTGSIALCGDTSINIWASQTADPNRTVIVSFGTPYLYTQYFYHIETFVNAYNLTEKSMHAFVKAMKGEFEPTGKCTIDIKKHI